jgi:hypothetical protein
MLFMPGHYMMLNIHHLAPTEAGRWGASCGSVTGLFIRITGIGLALGGGRKVEESLGELGLDGDMAQLAR